jgi:large subunit ribosomal protein L25
MEKMEKAAIQATVRAVTGKQVGQLRRDGKLPGVMYGRHFDTTPITMDLKEATRILSGLTSSSLVNIDLDGKQHAALVREKQRDYIVGTLKHVDFQVVSLTEKIRATVSIEFSGASPAVKDYNGVVVTGINDIDVECLPQYLPERIVVDISALARIGDGIYVRDIEVPKEVEVLEDQDEMVVIITAPVAEEVEVTEVVAAAEEPELIEKGKKEEEEGAEGATEES